MDHVERAAPRKRAQYGLGVTAKRLMLCLLLWCRAVSQRAVSQTVRARFRTRASLR